MIFEQNKKMIDFENNALEVEYKTEQDLGIRHSLRSSVISSLISWSLAIIVVFFVLPEHFIEVSSVIIITTYPYFTFVIYATYHDKYILSYQWMAAVSNSGAGFLVIYCFTFLPEYNEFFTLMNLILVVSFASYLRLRFPYVVTATFSYILGFQIYIILFSTLALPYIIVLSFLAWMTEFFAIWMGFVSERTNRTLFIQKKTIHEQKEIIQKEQQKSEKLLSNMLPDSIAERLKEHESIIADSFDEISVLFADLVGFTELSNNIRPEALVTLLNDIFSRFDQSVEVHGLEKIKTIGDAYMVAGGLSKFNENHIEAIADLALAMRQDLFEFNSERQQSFNIRIGIHVGSAVAGVIGVKKFVYDVWGDTVNLASRMESHGISGQIQVSEKTYENLKKDFEFQERGVIDVKGKGKMKTFLLKGRKP